MTQNSDDRNRSTGSIDDFRLQGQIEHLHQTLAAMAERSENIAAVLIALMAQHGDPTHVDVKRAAQLRGCSAKTIRRAIAEGELTLEVIPGTRRSGIPLEQIYSRWLPIGAARRAIERVRNETLQLSGDAAARTGVHSRRTKER